MQEYDYHWALSDTEYWLGESAMRFAHLFDIRIIFLILHVSSSKGPSPQREAPALLLLIFLEPLQQICGEWVIHA